MGNVPEVTLESLVGQADRFMTFTGLKKANATDLFFLVMGISGAGKSSFISRCTCKDTNISHGLISCTKDIGVYDFVTRGRRVYLIDTPAFNGTNRSDVDILHNLATWLGASYGNGVQIHGIIILHPISDNKLAGSGMRNIEMIKAICGFLTYDNVLIATTRWPVNPNRDIDLEARESELQQTETFFGGLKRLGAGVVRYCENGGFDSQEAVESAQHIVCALIERCAGQVPEVLAIQHELIVERKCLEDTTAGKLVASPHRQLRGENVKLLHDLEKKVNENLARGYADFTAVLEEQKIQEEADSTKYGYEAQQLQQSIREMHEAEKKALKERFEFLEKYYSLKLEEQEQELREMKDSLAGMMKDAAQPIDTDGYMEDMKEAERRVEKERRLLEEFEKLKAQIVNGVANGLAGGLVGGALQGIIAGAMGALCLVM